MTPEEKVQHFKAVLNLESMSGRQHDICLFFIDQINYQVLDKIPDTLDSIEIKNYWKEVRNVFVKERHNAMVKYMKNR